MDGIFKAALIIHILFGSVALFVAPACDDDQQGRPLAPALGQTFLLGDHGSGDHGCRDVAHPIRVVFPSRRFVQLLSGLYRVSRFVSQNSAATRYSRGLDRGFSDARRQRGVARLRCVFDADLEFWDGRSGFRSPGFSFRH